MELVYLWVEEYKNIKNQGFNFSPRFECEFDGKNLTITENEDYVSIFPDNINVTAIVGENGSGKSSILNEINYKNYKNFIIFDSVKKQLISCRHKIIINETNLELIELEENWNEYYERIFISWDLLGSEYTPENIINQHTEENKTFNEESFILKDRKLVPILFEQKMLTYLFEKKYRLLSSIFNFFVEKLEIKFKPLFNLTITDKINNKINKKINNKINKKIERINKKLEESSLKNTKLDLKNYFLLYIYKKYENDKSLDEIRNNYINKKLDDLLIEIFNTVKDEHNRPVIDIEEIANLKIEIAYTMVNVLCNSKIYLIEEFSSIYEKNKDIIDFFIECSFIEIDYINKDNIKFSSLSQGQRTIFMQNLLIYSKINEFNSDKPIFLLLDEIDVNLHPRWQKEQISNLINLLSKEEKKFHIIITSHSPFILSDLQKENIIFLDKVDYKTKEKYPKLNIDDLEDGNCINVSKYIELKTFGANIHTLLSDGFFMSDGLMGEFAKSKIEEIKKFYELVKKCEKIITKSENVKNTIKNIYQGYEQNFRNIQNIIGEKFLQTIIKNYLDELEILFNGKNQFLDNEIKRLQSLKDD